MKRKEVKEVLDRVLTWPADLQETAVEMLLDLEEGGEAGEPTDDYFFAILEELGAPLDSDEELEAFIVSPEFPTRLFDKAVEKARNLPENGRAALAFTILAFLESIAEAAEDEEAPSEGETAQLSLDDFFSEPEPESSSRPAVSAPRRG